MKLFIGLIGLVAVALAEPKPNGYQMPISTGYAQQEGYATAPEGYPSFDDFSTAPTNGGFGGFMSRYGGSFAALAVARMLR